MKQFSWVLLLALTSCSKTPPKGAFIDPALSILVPPDTTLLAGVHVEALRKMPLYQKYLKDANLPGLDEMIAKTSLDPRKDLWEVLAISDGKHSTILVRADFAGEIESKLERQGAKRMGHKMYYMLGNEEAAIVFFNSTTAAVGNTDSLRALIDARGKSNGPPPAIAARLAELPREAQIFAVWLGGAMPFTADLRGNLSNATRIVNSLQSGSLALDLSTGINGSVKGEARTEDDAQAVRDALKALIGFGRLSAPSDQPDLLQVFDGLQVTQEKNQVRLNIEEREDLLEKYLGGLYRGGLKSR